MISELALLAVLFILAFGGTFFVRNWALKKSIIDIPNKRSSHTTPTPRGGGLAIGITWYAFLIFWYSLGKIELHLFLALFSSILIAVVSFIDDMRSLSPRIRFVSQLLSSALALVFLGGLQHIELGFADMVLPLWVNILVLFVILWMINLFNFLDGIDGYLGMEGSFVFFSLFLLTGDIMSLAFAVIILGFLYWNWPRAKIFCGDIGSTLIGFTLIIMAIYYQNESQVSFIIPLLLSGLFWVDASVTLIRRWWRKEKLSEAHRKHAYQRLTQGGFSHKKVLFIGIAINLCLLGLALLITHYSKYLLVGLGVQILLILFYIRFADRRKAFH